MQEIICLLIAFLSFSHGQFNAEDYQYGLNYQQEPYNIKNGTYSQDNDLLPKNTISQQSQYFRFRRRFKCIKSGTYADGYNCRKYYECIKVENRFRRPKFHQIVHKCKFGKVFSYVHGTCTDPWKSGRGECINFYRWLKRRLKGGSEITTPSSTSKEDNKSKESLASGSREGSKSQKDSEENLTTPLVPPEGESGSKEDNKNKESLESGSKEGSKSQEGSEENLTTPLVPPEGESGSKEDNKNKKSLESGSKEGSKSQEDSEENLTTPLVPREGESGSQEGSKSQEDSEENLTTPLVPPKGESGSKEGSKSQEGSDENLTTPLVPSEGESGSKEDNKNKESLESGSKEGSKGQEESEENLTTPLVPPEGESGSKEDNKNKESLESGSKEGSKSQAGSEENLTTPLVPSEGESGSKEGSKSQEESEENFTTPLVPPEGESGSKEDNKNKESLESGSKEGSKSQEGSEENLTTALIPPEGESGSKEGNKNKESLESGSIEGSKSQESSDENLTTPLVPPEGESGSKEDNKSQESLESGSREGSKSEEGSEENLTTPLVPPEGDSGSKEDNSKESLESGSREGSKSQEGSEENLTTPLIPTKGESESNEDSKSKESRESESNERSKDEESSEENVTTPMVPTESGSKEDSQSEEEEGDSTSKCTSAGFFPDVNDCTKFYRCVEIGPKIFDKFDFECAQGTVWDQDKTICNSESAVEKLSCRKKGENVSKEDGKTDNNEEQTTTDFPTSTELPTLSTTPTELNCPIGNLTGDQIALVCPTGFRRHPKYCNLFYQCTTVNNVGAKVVVFFCPYGTIFDDIKIQCVNENIIYKSLPGYSSCKNFNSSAEDISKSLLKAPTRKLCPRDGRFPYDKGCSNAYYKCHRDVHGALQGYLFKCSNGRIFSSVSRRCERTEYNSKYNVSCKQRNNTGMDNNIHHAPSKGVYITYQKVFYIGLIPPPSYFQRDENHLKE